ncbi:serpin family protein [Haloterrigena salinisoli]|uniref:serpin family protein n=1 Tax=Haloterrigena salinisoli TaxID=3132747 RepID=UPI0030D1B179
MAAFLAVRVVDSCFAWGRLEDGDSVSFRPSLTGTADGTRRRRKLKERLPRPKVDLAFPTFGIESKFSLVETMRESGMERAFDGASADFSGMVESDESDLFVDDVIHQSFVEVDEEGTEAAAATIVVVADSAVPDRVELTVDRPFLFYVRDRPTETPLFVGRVVDGEMLQDA